MFPSSVNPSLFVSHMYSFHCNTSPINHLHLLPSTPLPPRHTFPQTQPSLSLASLRNPKVLLSGSIASHCHAPDRTAATSQEQLHQTNFDRILRVIWVTEEQAGCLDKCERKEAWIAPAFDLVKPYCIQVAVGVQTGFFWYGGIYLYVLIGVNRQTLMEKPMIYFEGISAI